MLEPGCPTEGMRQEVGLEKPVEVSSCRFLLQALQEGQWKTIKDFYQEAEQFDILYTLESALT